MTRAASLTGRTAVSQSVVVYRARSADCRALTVPGVGALVMAEMRVAALSPQAADDRVRVVDAPEVRHRAQARQVLAPEEPGEQGGDGGLRPAGEAQQRGLLAGQQGSGILQHGQQALVARGQGQLDPGEVEQVRQHAAQARRPWPRPGVPSPSGR